MKCDSCGRMIEKTLTVYSTNEEVCQLCYDKFVVKEDNSMDIDLSNKEEISRYLECLDIFFKQG